MSLPDHQSASALSNDDIQRRLHAVIRASRQEALAALASKVAHDLNNVLQVVSGRLDLIDQYPVLPAEVREDVQNAMVGIDLAHRLLSQLRGYVLRDDFGLPQINAVSLFGEVEALMNAELPPHIRLLSEISAPELAFPAQRDQICAALVELVSNAIEVFGAQPGIITMQAQLVRREQPVAGIPQELEFAALTVRDSGAGFDAQTLKQAADPFTSTRGMRRGIGLALVRGIARAHAGSIEIENHPSGGACVTLLLPINPPDYF